MTIVNSIYFSYLGHAVTETKNGDLEIKMNRFNQIRFTLRTTLNIKTRKDIQIKFYKSMTVHILAYGSEIWTTTKIILQRWKF